MLSRREVRSTPARRIAPRLNAESVPYPTTTRERAKRGKRNDGSRVRGSDNSAFGGGGGVDQPDQRRLTKDHGTETTVADDQV